MRISISSSKQNKQLSPIFAAISSRELSKKMMRVSSSNIWSMGYDPGEKNLGRLIIQFKGSKGGPGDLYLYYDVPVKIYQKMITSTSKGHAFWIHIRNRYKYSKLTGDKKAKTPWGV